MELLQLIRECKQGSITAQKYLYDRFAVQFFLVCRRYLKTDAEAEEILQNGFLKIFNGLQHFSYASDAASVAWMKKIIINECLQELRKKNSFFLVAEDDAAEINTADDILGKLSADDIYKLITQMPVGYRTVFNLYVIEGYNHMEIATILNISEGTSKSQLNKARKTLQQSVTQNNLYAGRKAK
ncbi:MAG: polymerase, sigma-24 subunit, subfamily [Sediminibacterium sp.]|nr:polymerase, sigma-24 subunit, subfamily [Sediminibacterium sp.]